jgi:hypothetical protein
VPKPYGTSPHYLRLFTRKAVNMEVWKDIKEYEGYYQISNFGSVYSVRYKRYRKPRIDQHGYEYIGLNKDGTQKPFFVHRLVANAFIPNPENKAEVNHIDGNKLNNNICNLEWVTHDENMDHAFSTGILKRGESKKTTKVAPTRKLSKSIVMQIRSEYRQGERGFGYKALAKKYGVADKTIKAIIMNAAIAITFRVFIFFYPFFANS